MACTIVHLASDAAILQDCKHFAREAANEKKEEKAKKKELAAAAKKADKPKKLAEQARRRKAKKLAEQAKKLAEQARLQEEAPPGTHYTGITIAGQPVYRPKRCAQAFVKN